MKLRRFCLVGLMLLLIGLVGCTPGEEEASSSKEPLAVGEKDLEQAVSQAILARGAAYLAGEKATEGHRILAVEEETEASNKLFAELTKHDPFLNACPYWLGTLERLEGGLRYIYETSQGKRDDGFDVITFRKTKEDGTVVEERQYKIVGKEVQRIR